MQEFDKEKFKKSVKTKYGTYEIFREVLDRDYRLGKKLNTVQKWGQISHPSVPTSRDLPVIAQALDIELVDLYTDADLVRQKITEQEIVSNPHRYSHSITSAYLQSIPEDIRQLLDYYRVINETDRQYYLGQIKSLAMKKLGHDN